MGHRSGDKTKKSSASSTQAVFAATAAASSTGEPTGSTHPRLINGDEGMAVIGAALEIRYRRHRREDCSHLVHDIYRQAGFPYPYADSSDLYEGVNAFRQVTRPQPGDLAVWKGHAAIVVNPAQHTFFSSTRTGLRVESYDLKYWKRRGTPRFFRYVSFAPPTIPSIIQTSDSMPARLHHAESHSADPALLPEDGDSETDPK